jgi:hypothetical protein
MTNRLLRRVPLAGAILSLLMVPQVALGATAPTAAKQQPQRHITITITDAGFDKASYTAAYSAGTSSNGSDSASVTFENKGTMVHSAKATPGSLDEGSALGQRTDGLGNVVVCQMGARCSKSSATDTGAIDPGGSVTLGFAPTDSTGVTYTLASATDCMFGNSTPGFDCTPITLKIVSIGASSLGGTFPGSLIRPVGSPECIQNLAAVVPTDGGPSFCYAAGRDPGKVAGSPAKPLGDTTINITDFGMDPTIAYVKGGSTVTWVNTGQRIHTIFKKGPPYPPDGYNLLDSGGLAPGDSYSYHFAAKADCPIPSGCSSTNYESLTDVDLIPQSMAGAVSGGGCGFSFNAKTHKQTSHNHNCGQPALVGAVKVIG